MPVPPVMRTVEAGSGGWGMVSTILPTWRAWLMNRNASAPRLTSQVEIGNRSSAPSSKSPRISVSIAWMRSGPASTMSKAW